MDTFVDKYIYYLRADCFLKIYHANDDVRTSDLGQNKYDNEADIQQH